MYAVVSHIHLYGDLLVGCAARVEILEADCIPIEQRPGRAE